MCLWFLGAQKNHGNPSPVIRFSQSAVIHELSLENIESKLIVCRTSLKKNRAIVKPYSKILVSKTNSKTYLNNLEPIKNILKHIRTYYHMLFFYPPSNLSFFQSPTPPPRTCICCSPRSTSRNLCGCANTTTQCWIHGMNMALIWINIMYMYIYIYMWDI